MKALILAAGYAVRLYPLTKEYPKALLTIGRKPIVNYIIAILEKLPQINEIIIVTNSKFISVFRKWKGRIKSTKRISLVDDLTRTPETRRGAIGDIGFSVREKGMQEDLLVIGGDNLLDGDFTAFLKDADSHSPHATIGLYDIKNKKEVSKYGVVRIDSRNKIIDFKEKPKTSSSTLVAMCLYYFPKEKIKLFKEYLKARGHKSDATGFYIDWLRTQEAVYGHEFKGRWYDIGDYKFYNKAKEEFSNSRGSILYRAKKKKILS